MFCIRDIILIGDILDAGPGYSDWILLLEIESFRLLWLWLAVVRRRLSVNRSANEISWTGFSKTGFSVTGFSVTSFSVTGFGLESVRRAEFAHGETARASSLTTLHLHGSAWARFFPCFLQKFNAYH